MIAVCVGAPTERGQVRAALAALRHRGFRTRVTATPVTCTSREGHRLAIVHHAVLRRGGTTVVATAIWDTYCWTFLVTDLDRSGRVEVPGPDRWFALAAGHARTLAPARVAAAFGDESRPPAARE